MLAKIVEDILDLILDLLIDNPRNRYSTGFRDVFQAVGHVDAIAKDVVAVDDHVSQIDPHPKLKLTINRKLVIAVAKFFLCDRSAGDGIYEAVKFGKNRVTSEMDDTAFMVFYRCRDEVEVFAESFVGALLVGPGQATIAVHVRVKDRRSF